MSRCSGYLAACTPRKEILIFQLRWEQLLLTSLLSLEGFRVHHRILDLRCITGSSGLPLQVVPLAMELVLWSVL
jgi:hypothetical protein